MTATTLEGTIQQLLAADTALSALVGNRIYPGIAPQDCARPYVVFLRTEGRNLGTLGGRGVHDLHQFGFGCAADLDDAMEAIAVSVALRKALDSYSSNGVLQAAIFVGQQQEAMADPSGRQLHLVTLHFSVLSAE